VSLLIQETYLIELLGKSTVPLACAGVAGCAGALRCSAVLVLSWLAALLSSGAAAAVPVGAALGSGRGGFTPAAEPSVVVAPGPAGSALLARAAPARRGAHAE